MGTEQSGDEVPEEVQGDTGDNETKSTSTRYQYTNDILAGALVAFAIVATFAYIYLGKTVPVWLWMADGASIVTAVVWAFGGGAFEKAASFISGGGE